MPDRIRIDAALVVAYEAGEHRLLRDGSIVVEGNQILYVGREFPGRVDLVVDARDRVVTPGLINTHTHLAGSPLDKSYIEDRGRRQFFMSGLAEMLPAREAAMDRDGQEACVDYSMGELLRTGTTTVLEIGPLGDYVADAAERAGLRVYIGQSYASGYWFTPDGKRIDYAWDEEAGFAGMRRAVDLIERLDGRANGRVRGYLSPMEVVTCSEALLRRSREVSESLGVPLALHVSESVFEFQEMVRRHGMTPVEWLQSIDFLTERCILGHVIFPAGSSWVQYQGDDLSILAQHGASVAHCVWVFARRGIAMESFPGYLAAGVNMTLGTDTAPQSMIEGLRWTAVLGKIMARRTDVATALDVFNAATLGGAKMLQRDDLGRIASGAKADLLFWNANSLFMTPLRDPLKNLVFNAQAEDLREVMIDGEWVVREGRPQRVDLDTVCRALQHAGERMWAEMGPGDWAGRDVDALSPQTLPLFEGIGA